MSTRLGTCLCCLSGIHFYFPSSTKNRTYIYVTTGRDEVGENFPGTKVYSPYNKENFYPEGALSMSGQIANFQVAIIFVVAAVAGVFALLLATTLGK